MLEKEYEIDGVKVAVRYKDSFHHYQSYFSFEGQDKEVMIYGEGLLGREKNDDGTRGVLFYLSELGVKGDALSPAHEKVVKTILTDLYESETFFVEFE